MEVIVRLRIMQVLMVYWLQRAQEVKDRNDAIENPNLMEPEKDPVTRPRVEVTPILMFTL